jgi:hypothetical protein
VVWDDRSPLPNPRANIESETVDRNSISIRWQKYSLANVEQFFKKSIEP